MGMIEIKICYTVFIFLCVCGCLYQVIDISNKYFAFKTTTRVDSELQDIVRYPDIILCARLSDFINESQHEMLKVSNKSLPELNIGKLLELTPDVKDSIEKCYLRLDTSKWTQEYSSQDCYKNIKLNKFISGDNVCYQYRHRVDLNYSISEVANALNFSHYVYGIFLKERFLQAKRMFMPANYPTSVEDKISTGLRFPYQSRKFGEIFQLYERVNWIILRPKEDYFLLLPAPYDTNCVYNNFFCHRECMMSNTTSKMRIWPYTEPSTGSVTSNMTVLSSEDLKNKQLALLWQDIQEYCEDRCSRPDCEISITTNIISINKHGQRQFLVLTVSVPSAYTTRITSVAATYFIDYVSGLCNSISIWFGFCVLVMNPVNFKVQVRESIFLKRGIRWASVTFYAVCVIGFLCQTSELCQQYFKYQTSSKIEVSYADTYPYESLGICFRTLDIIDRSKSQKVNISGALNQIFNNEEIDLSLMTVKQIFRLTPENESIIIQCGIRDAFDWGITTYPADYCRKQISVAKAILGEQTCYFIHLRERKSYSWTKVSTSFIFKSVVYEVKLSININSTLPVIAMSTTTQTGIPLPLLSRSFAQRLTIYPKNVVRVSAAYNEYTSLPPPYDTQCESRPEYYDCYSTCLTAAVGLHNRAPYSVFITNKSVEMKMLSYKDLENQTLQTMIFQRQELCNNECSKILCKQYVSFSSTRSYHLDDGDTNHLIMVSMVPEAPAFYVTSVPATYPLDFFLLLFNCFGIWFGLSILSFDPTNILKWYLKVPTVQSQFLRCTVTSRKMIETRILRKLFFVFSLSGFIWQIQLLSLNYFAFITSSRIEMLFTDQYPFPNLVICGRYLDWVRLDNSTIITEQIAKTMSDLTVRQIFDRTPHEKSVLIGCRYRERDGRDMIESNYEECREQWLIVKYLYGESVCYDFLPKVKMQYSLTKVSSAATHVGIVYQLYLSESLLPAEYLSFVSYTHLKEFMEAYASEPSKWPPILSRKYADHLFQDRTQPYNYFIVQNTLMNITLLPPPYDTMCSPNETIDFCAPDCNTAYKKKYLDRVPFHEIITVPVDMKMVSKHDFKNETVKKIIQAGNQKCSEQCHFHSCDSHYSLTHVGGYYDSTVKSDRLILAAGVPKTNGFIVTTFPSLSLMDYFNTLAVSGSIWLGVSALSISMFPISIMAKYYNKKHTKKQQKKHKRVPGVKTPEMIDRQTKVVPRIYCPCRYCRRHFQELEITIPNVHFWRVNE